MTKTRGNVATAGPLLPVGEIKDYKLLGLLATGGMAQLFLARKKGAESGQSLVAIKRIIPALAGDAQAVVRFLDEARIAIPLDHPNIVKAIDADIVDGEVFLAMEYLHGRDARSVWKRARSRGRRIPLDSAVAIAVAVATGLHHAHERCTPDGRSLRIIHRDISPHNVIITYDGAVKIIDFGIAKAATNLSRTRLGTFTGKLAYASPEQLRCEPVDRRTDIFSLGAVLFELTTGARAFPQPNDFTLLKAITEDETPRPSAVDPTYPPALERIVLRALARDRSERYATAETLQRDLEAFASECGLDLSPAYLARVMADLFHDELDQLPGTPNRDTRQPRIARIAGTTRSQRRTEPDGVQEDRKRTANQESRAADHAPVRTDAGPQRERGGSRRLVFPSVGVALLAAGLASIPILSSVPPEPPQYAPAVRLGTTSPEATRHAPVATAHMGRGLASESTAPSPHAVPDEDRVPPSQISSAATDTGQAQPRRFRRNPARRRSGSPRRSPSATGRPLTGGDPIPSDASDAQLDEPALDRIVPR